MRKHIFKISVAILLIYTTFASTAYAAIRGSGGISIQTYLTYGDFQNGDVIFTINPTIGTCAGVWIYHSQPGAKTIVATMLAAKLLDKKVLIYVDDAAVWPGSTTTKYCKVYTMGMQ